MNLNLNFSQEREFQANEAFLCKTRKEKPRMVGQSNTKKWG
jgi:hypothetical protein